jgi:hypothetical protein
MWESAFSADFQTKWESQLLDFSTKCHSRAWPFRLLSKAESNNWFPYLGAPTLFWPSCLPEQPR